METSICLANPCFLSSEKNMHIYFFLFTQRQNNLAPQQHFPSTYFSTPPSLVSRLSVEHMAVTPLLVLADCEDAETCWLVGKKMPFHVACNRNVLGVFNSSVTLNLDSLQFQWLCFNMEIGALVKDF